MSNTDVPTCSTGPSSPAEMFDRNQARHDQRKEIITCPPGSSPDARPDSAAPWPRRSSPQATTRSSPPATSGTVADLAVADTDRVLALSLDVTDAARVTGRGQSRPKRQFGGIHVLVNNAGYGYRAAVEEGDDVRHPGIVRYPVLRRSRDDQGGAAWDARPPLRRASSTSPRSVSRSCPTGSGYYAASKAALEGMSGALHGRAEATRHLRHRRRAWRVPHRFRRPFAHPVQHRHRCLRRHRRQTPQGTRHRCTAPSQATRAKAAHAIIAAAESDEPPPFLLLGKDALSTYRRLAAARLNTIEAWEYLSTSTDLDA